MRTVYLIRHAEPHFPDGSLHRCIGSRSDPPLSPEGIAAVASLREWFSGRSVSAVGTSPLERCRHTASLLFPGLSFSVLPDMAETDCGEWDGLSFDTIRAEYPDLYDLRGRDPSVPPPGGETYAHAAGRGIAAVRAFLALTRGDIAVVGHAGINRAVLCSLAGISFSGIRNIPMDYLSVYSLIFEDGVLRAGPLLKG